MLSYKNRKQFDRFSWVFFLFFWVSTKELFNTHCVIQGQSPPAALIERLRLIFVTIILKLTFWIRLFAAEYSELWISTFKKWLSRKGASGFYLNFSVRKSFFFL